MLMLKSSSVKMWVGSAEVPPTQLVLLCALISPSRHPGRPALCSACELKDRYPSGSGQIVRWMLARLSQIAGQ